MDSKNKILQDISKYKEGIRNLRQAERRISNNVNKNLSLSSEPSISRGGSIIDNLVSILPKNLVPANVGNVNDVMYPFFYRTIHDFGTDPTFTSNTVNNQTFNISQDAAFILTSIYRCYEDVSDVGKGAPLEMTIRDLQSSRQFNDSPIPIQAIGFKGHATYLPTPFYMSPNASVQIELSSFVPNDQAETGEGRQIFVFQGYRIRTGDIGKVLSTIFSEK